MDDTRSAGDDGGPDLDLMAVFPRLTQLGHVLNRSGLTERAMERAGLSLDKPAMSVLVTLKMADRPLRIGEIAERMQVVGPHVTRQMNELERRGLARRATDPDDQRARLIELTPEGAAAAERYLGTILGLYTDVLAGWPARDRQDFGRLLGRFVDDLTARLAAIGDERPAP
ncbi:MarR family winged helix-turn-helix transcriptional regulator [Actinoallomurus iriomotensis]|uniref:MarR family transcriptional regulator n=1 Tax=Actinoallomurus iriomotensis TaxID=478107 RepID=A0A9W6S2C8_9ACTN|nr:MarR family transcriptional regulator [Actinoallomurus iriomotensis]GLY84492.1 MarR family transcriptional regulator [Actinoallomurus iriomotensis]